MSTLVHGHVSSLAMTSIFVSVGVGDVEVIDSVGCGPGSVNQSLSESISLCMRT